jgi:hypothetical protein
MRVILMPMPSCRFGRVQLTCLLLALAACSSLPKGWPIKELTLPPKSTVAAMPERARTLREKINIVPEIGGRIPLMPAFAVAYKSEIGWDQQVSSVESQLTPLGYTAWKPTRVSEVQGVVSSIGEAKDFDSTIRIWESPDKKQVVNLINCTVLVEMGQSIDKPGDYILCISPLTGAS